MEKKNNVGKKEKKAIKEIKKEIKKGTKNVTRKVTKTVQEKRPKKVIEKQKKVIEKKVQEPVIKPEIEEEREPFLVDIKKIKNEKRKKYLTCLELLVIIAVSVILLLLLCNRTFFRNNYKNSKININIPLLMFFKSDDGNKLVMNTLRNEEYVKDFFNDELSSMTKYTCNGFNFYYDELNHVAFYDVKIENTLFVKKVSIDYAAGSSDCLCNVNTIGKEAEELCKK